jgi:hypothetical protein
VNLFLNWVKCGNDTSWCSLENVNLSDVNTEGIYIIWHQGNPGRVVRIGQGKIADRVGVHREDASITAYEGDGSLRVTWAYVEAKYRGGVERYLAEKWKPLVGERFPMVESIVVNSPW